MNVEIYANSIMQMANKLEIIGVREGINFKNTYNIGQRIRICKMWDWVR